MRFLWAGLILLLTAGTATAQVTGAVRGLGFAGNYRPDCWTPLLVELNSTISQPGEYQIQVMQQDLDQDTVVFTRTVTVGPQARERVWIYFLPQPTEQGLPDPSSPIVQLGDVLKVHLYDKSGRNHIAALPVQTQANNFEAKNPRRGTKLVLVVGNGASVTLGQYVNTQGLTEDVTYVTIPPSMLPDHVLGYESVDAILWADAKLTDFRGTPGFTAMQDWIRRGGNFAICQPTDRSQLDPLIDADMLPVIARSGTGWALSLKQKANLSQLSDIAGDNADGFKSGAWVAAETAHATFEVAYAKARPDAMVDAWVTWPAHDDVPEEKTPFIARRAYGLGSVTWVAQDLTQSALIAAPIPGEKPKPGEPARSILTNGWPRVWDRVFGWRNQPRTPEEAQNIDSAQKSDAAREARHKEFADGSPVDLGAQLAKGVEHTSRSAAYVFLAVIFFIGYWIIAGPGTYLFLAAKKKRGLSWAAFGATAVAATLLTVVVVRLLLGGGTEVKHVSLVRLTPDASAADGTPQFTAVMSSRIGLYIPRDGNQRVSVAAPQSERSAHIAPFAIHPQWLKADKDAGFTDTAKYYVDLDPVLAGQSPATDFFVRSTLKKVQAQWVGQVAEGITGAAELLNDGSKPIAGQLTNKTGRKLTQVYFIFTHGWQDANSTRTAPNDRALYLPEWPKDAAIDLTAEWSAAGVLTEKQPGYADKVRGTINPITMTAWTEFWYADMPHGFAVEALDDRNAGYRRSVPLMSLIDRVGPYKDSKGNSERTEPLRRGGREMNVSQLVASGKLVILAQAADSPVPVPVDVNGDRITGQGLTFYEIALPLSREKLRPAESQPSTRPTSMPTTMPGK